MKKCILGICLILIIMAICLVRNSEREPDCVGSISTNADQHLTVVAYRSYIKDKEEFAWNLIKMCQDNAFKTIKFSTDLRRYPTSLDINVYLWEKDIDKGKVEMDIRFKPTDYSQGYDIVNDADKFKLYIDGELIG